MSLLKELNHHYISLHEAKEEAFWSAKMGLKNNVPGVFEEKEIELKGFTSDATVLPKIRTELERNGLSAEERTGLEGWLKFFEVNTIESREAIELQNKIIEME